MNFQFRIIVILQSQYLFIINLFSHPKPSQDVKTLEEKNKVQYQHFQPRDQVRNFVTTLRLDKIRLKRFFSILLRKDYSTWQGVYPICFYLRDNIIFPALCKLIYRLSGTVMVNVKILLLSRTILIKPNHHPSYPISITTIDLYNKRSRCFYLYLVPLVQF